MKHFEFHFHFIQKLIISFFSLVCLLLIRFAETEMPEKRAMQIVHRTQASRVPRRGQYESIVSMSTESSMPTASYRLRCYLRQKLCWRQYSNIFRLLYGRQFELNWKQNKQNKTLWFYLFIQNEKKKTNQFANLVTNLNTNKYQQMQLCKYTHPIRWNLGIFLKNEYSNRTQHTHTHNATPNWFECYVISNLHCIILVREIYRILYS